MKSFKNFLNEDTGFPTGPVGENPNNLAGEVTDTLGTDVGDPANLKRIKAIIGAISNMEYLLPEHAIEKLRYSLSKIHLTFGKVPTMEGSSGSFELPLTRFGGRFGKDTDTPADEIINDDGISHMIEGGLALKIQYEMLQNSSCRIFAKIV